MSEFFDKPNGPTGQEQVSAQDENYKIRAQAEVIEIAAELKEPLAYLYNELTSKGVPADTVYALPKPREYSRKLKGLKPLEPVDDVMRGWTISESVMRRDKQSIVLLDDGTLILGETVSRSEVDEKGKVKPGFVTPHSEVPGTGTLDLDTYPVHSLFEQIEGYKFTGGSLPNLEPYKEGRISQASPEARVAINLRAIEADLREKGRNLLKIV